jgi:hypothetical protein
MATRHLDDPPASQLEHQSCTRTGLDAQDLAQADKLLPVGTEEGARIEPLLEIRCCSSRPARQDALSGAGDQARFLR